MHYQLRMFLNAKRKRAAPRARSLIGELQGGGDASALCQQIYLVVGYSFCRECDANISMKQHACRTGMRLFCLCRTHSLPSRASMNALINARLNCLQEVR